MDDGAERLEREKKLIEKEADATVENLLSRAGVQMSRRFAVGWVDQMMREYPGVKVAFFDKAENPYQWHLASDWLAQELRREVQSMLGAENA